MTLIDLAVLPSQLATFFVSCRLGIVATALLALVIVSTDRCSLLLRKAALLTAFVAASGLFTLMLRQISPYPWFNDFSVAFGIFISASCYLLYNFKKQMITFSVFSCAFLLYAGYDIDSLRMAAMNISTICILSLILFLYQGHLSRLLIEKTYESLSRVIPIDIAKKSVAKNLSIGEIEELRPRDSFGVALCSDWRDYQNLASKLSPQDIASLFEDYYGKVFKEVGQPNSSVAVFTDWVADELMVIFYPRDEKVSKSDVARRAFEFAMTLRGLGRDLSKEGLSRIQFDIGIAAGYGLIGLQGPSGHQKLVMIGKTPGLAKRLESVAKEVRTSLVAEPTLVLNDDFCDLLNPEQKRQFVELRTNVKNLSDQRVFCSRGTDESMASIESKSA